MIAWSAFFQAQVSASSALAGLVFVGLSINFTRIIGSSHLPNRALEALAVLLLNLILSSLFLVPAQNPLTLAIEVLALTTLTWIGVSILHVRNFHEVDPAYRRRSLFGTVLGQVAVASLWVGGVVLLKRGAAGVGALVPGLLLSYLLAMLNAWVLLVEINR